MVIDDPLTFLSPAAAEQEQREEEQRQPGGGGLSPGHGGQQSPPTLHVNVCPTKSGPDRPRTLIESPRPRTADETYRSLITVSWARSRPAARASSVRGPFKRIKKGFFLRGNGQKILHMDEKVSKMEASHLEQKNFRNQITEEKLESFH